MCVRALDRIALWSPQHPYLVFTSNDVREIDVNFEVR